jgi:hypothetical protein
MSLPLTAEPPPLTTGDDGVVRVGGAQRGRWRVRARVGGQVCPWSDWHYFTYTV